MKARDPYTCEATKDTFERYAASYDQRLRETVGFSGQGPDFFARAKAELLERVIMAHFGSSKELTALDIGCGTGILHGELSSLGLSLEGVDVAEEPIRIARERHEGVRYQVYDGESLPFADGQIDISFAVCVLHHVAPGSRQSFLAEMRRVTRPGGICCVIEHNPLNPLTRLAVWRCPFDEGVELISARRMRHLFDGAGCVSLSTTYFLFFPFRNSMSAAIERRLSGVPLGAQYCVSGVVPHGR